MAISLLAIFQGAFVSALPDFFNEINVLILILVFVLSFWNLRICLYWAIGFALMMDLYSFLIFGTYLIIFPIVIILANFLFVNFFTNRSLYSLLALSLFSSIIFKLLLFILSYLYYFFALRNYFLRINFNDELRVLALESILAVLFFYFFSYLNKNSRSAFLSKYK